MKRFLKSDPYHVNFDVLWGMRKVLVAVLVMLFWCNVVQAKIILSKCYIAKWKYESKDKPEMIQKKFDDKKSSILSQF